MSGYRLADYLEHMEQAASDACEFVAGMVKEQFFEDKRTQQAVLMSLFIIGESATKLVDRYPNFIAAHGQVPWKNMRGMRNRIAHAYFDTNLDIVWESVHKALPELLGMLPALIVEAGTSDSGSIGLCEPS
ncbi:DUF86 domain-containing protein [Pigmentiphaga litoralis]|uniref:HepT-like ribonuclease domain-containing protein n=1 Tax=Pigmentiphaga litoralis TaxID=516702 RepID=UPI003B437FC1